MADDSAISAADLLRWSEALSAIARTGLGFTKSLYEQERFEEVLKVAADIRVAAGHELESEVLVEEWLKQVGEGVPGYVTPKIAIGGVVGELKGHPLETSDVGWFSEDALPQPLAGWERWGAHVFRVLRGESVDVLFDSPRDPIWREKQGDQRQP